jgi:hypothetical protein
MPAPPGWRLAKAADLDGDGVSELWWQTHVPGLLEVWKVSMAQRLDVLARVATSAEGDLVEVADFDGDGVPDGLWRDRVWGVLTITRFTPGGGGSSGTLREEVALPWLPGDADLDVRGAVDLDARAGAEIVVQHRATRRVQAIFASGRSAPRREVLFDLARPADLVLVR